MPMPWLTQWNERSRIQAFADQWAKPRKNGRAGYFQPMSSSRDMSGSTARFAV
jgi:hypothetical protein